jgi:hypothetical protein
MQLVPHATPRALNQGLAVDWTERDLYRIDRYLGKEVIDNLLVMRFANRLLTPIWNRENVSNVQIIFKEPFGVNTGYFDSHGIIRDVLQNHLLQILAVLAMDRPVSLEPEDIRDAKLKVLRQAGLDTTFHSRYYCASKHVQLRELRPRLERPRHAEEIIDDSRYGPHVTHLTPPGSERNPGVR